VSSSGLERLARTAYEAHRGAHPTPLPPWEIVIQVGDQRHSFSTTFTVGRQGNIVITDEFASSHHARFQVAHGLWFVEDLGSTNGTWLNGRRFRAPQHLKKGDKVKIGRTVMTVVSA
jgi:pSer/pThr/pTyr-binding forkhead associated (FHA) protein